MEHKKPMNEEELRRLIKGARTTEDDNSVRPAPEVIAAYIQGTASEKEREEVQDALIKSPEFRRELLQTAKDLEALEAEEAAMASEEVEAETMTINKPAFQRRKPSFADRIRSFGDQLLSLRIPQVYLPVVATAALLTLVIIQRDWFAPGQSHEAAAPADTTSVSSSPMWNLAVGSVSPRLLISMSNRSIPSKPEEVTYDKPQDAALAQFRSMLTLDIDDNFVPLEDLPAASPTPAGYPITLQVQDNRVGETSVFTGYVPVTKGERPDSVTAWIMTLPLKNLYRLEVVSDTLRADWPGEIDGMGVLTLTYRLPDGKYSATGQYVWRTPPESD